MNRITPNVLVLLQRQAVCSWFKVLPSTVVFKKSLCTEVTPSLNNQSEPVNIPPTALDFGALIQSAEKKNLSVHSACEIVIGIAGLKKESKVSQSDYLQDERFLKIMKVLEGTNTSRVEPMAIISSLKVGCSFAITVSIKMFRL